MDFSAHYAELLLHYTRLARMPAWRDYVRDRLQRLESECPELYGGMLEDVRAALKGQGDDRGER